MARLAHSSVNHQASAELWSGRDVCKETALHLLGGTEENSETPKSLRQSAARDLPNITNKQTSKQAISFIQFSYTLQVCANSETPAFLTQGFHGFLQSLQAMKGYFFDEAAIVSFHILSNSSFIYRTIRRHRLRASDSHPNTQRSFCK
jgi:hypothetical protein